MFDFAYDNDFYLDVEASVEEMTTCNLNGENLVECIVKSFPLVLTEILDGNNWS